MAVVFLVVGTLSIVIDSISMDPLIPIWTGKGKLLAEGCYMLKAIISGTASNNERRIFLIFIIDKL
jgi:hypothetical protein